jgi:hypothetical protein
LLAYVHTLVPPGAEVVVIGDSEFSPLQATLESWSWCYVLRQKGSHLFRCHPDQAWQRCAALVTRPGQRCWLRPIELTHQSVHPCNLLALWQTGEKVPWLLATNLPTAQLTRLHYARRMWTEEMFADFKSNGFNL